MFDIQAEAEKVICFKLCLVFNLQLLGGKVDSNQVTVTDLTLLYIYQPMENWTPF